METLGVLTRASDTEPDALPPDVLPLDDYRRYGRQMILDGFGLPGQLKLHKASVAVVGAGGLGCPAIQYLAAAGVGRLGIIDHDVVELSNLQRQILHSEETLGMPKAVSATQAVKRINPRTFVSAHAELLTSSNAATLLAPYDLILDCTDNLPTRYLLSDTAVALSKPLVSGAAQQFDGQLAVYNRGPAGPCFRCVFPVPPPQETARGCAETGVLGAVTGVIGNLQALEAIKILTGLDDGPPTLLIFSARAAPPFRSIKLRARRPSCAACGVDALATRAGAIRDTDYVRFCGGAAPDWDAAGRVPGADGTRVTPKELKDALDAGRTTRIIDVRPPTEFGICHLPGSINIPLRDVLASPASYLSTSSPNDTETETIVVCRLGNDSQLAADALRQAGAAEAEVTVRVRDLVGGLVGWAERVDVLFPVY